MALVRRRPGSPYWYADFYDRSGARHQPSTRRVRKRDAQELADQWERESLRDPIAVARDAATFRQALDLLSSHLLASVNAATMAPDTADHYVAKAKRLKEYFGDARPLATIDTAAVRDYCTARRVPRVVTKRDGSQQSYPAASSHTLTKEVNTLRLAMRLAAERGLWQGSLDTLQPAELSARYTPRTRALTAAEVDQLRTALMRLSPHRWAVVAFCLATGAEKRAYLRAHRRDIDTSRSWVHVKGTKGEKRDRDVPMVLDLCRDLLDEALAYATGDRARPGASPAEELRAARRPLFEPWKNVSRDLGAACTAAGIPRASLNDLRRSWATWHVEAGVALDTLFRPMGHTTPIMLARTYTKPRRETTAEAMRVQIDARRRPKKGDDER